MSVRAIMSGVSQFCRHPIQNSSDLITRVQKIYAKNEDARQELQATALLTGFGFLGGALVGALYSKFGRKVFSLGTTLKCGAVGAGGGLLISLFVLYKFIVDFKKREQA